MLLNLKGTTLYLKGRFRNMFSKLHGSAEPGEVPGVKPDVVTGLVVRMPVRRLQYKMWLCRSIKSCLVQKGCGADSISMTDSAESADFRSIACAA